MSIEKQSTFSKIQQCFESNLHTLHQSGYLHTKSATCWRGFCFRSNCLTFVEDFCVKMKVSNSSAEECAGKIAATIQTTHCSFSGQFLWINVDNVTENSQDTDQRNDDDDAISWIK